MFAADIRPHNKCCFCFMCAFEDGVKSWPRWSCLLSGLLLDQAFPARSPPCSRDMADSGSSGEFSVSLTSSALPPPRTRIFKIIVIGDSGVGKTCLTYRFCAGKFPEKTEATIGVDFRERLVEIDGEKIKVSVLPKREETWPLILQPYNEWVKENESFCCPNPEAGCSGRGFRAKSLEKHKCKPFQNPFICSCQEGLFGPGNTSPAGPPAGGNHSCCSAASKNRSTSTQLLYVD